MTFIGSIALCFAVMTAGNGPGGMTPIPKTEKCYQFPSREFSDEKTCWTNVHHASLMVRQYFLWRYLAKYKAEKNTLGINFERVGFKIKRSCKPKV